MRTLVALVLSVVAVGLLAAGCGRAHRHRATKPAAVTVPRIHEGFTVLPCPRKPGTTLAIEGCTERKILRTDAAINGQAQAIFALLSPAGRRAFVAGERSWLAYRKATCSADASPYAGGTAQPLVFGSCVVEQNRRHLAALAALKRDLQRVG